METEKKIVWFAACDGIRKMGPYDSQVRAWESLKCAPLTSDELATFGRLGVKALKSNIHVKGAYVWPEHEE